MRVHTAGIEPVSIVIGGVEHETQGHSLETAAAPGIKIHGIAEAGHLETGTGRFYLISEAGGFRAA